MAGVTQADALNKFDDLSKSHGGSAGYMVSTLSIDYCAMLETENWEERFDSKLARDRPFLSLNLSLPLFGETVPLRFDRPCVRVFKSEFESHFGFGGGCTGYDPKRVVIVFKRNPTQPELITQLSRESCSVETPIDSDFALQLLMVMLLEGHVKSWTAIDMMADWFVEAGIESCTNFVEDKVWLKYIFEHMIEQPANIAVSTIEEVHSTLIEQPKSDE